MISLYKTNCGCLITQVTIQTGEWSLGEKTNITSCNILLRKLRDPTSLFSNDDQTINKVKDASSEKFVKRQTFTSETEITGFSSIIFLLSIRSGLIFV